MNTPEQPDVPDDDAEQITIGFEVSGVLGLIFAIAVLAAVVAMCGFLVLPR